jgi:hypothetical protein
MLYLIAHAAWAPGRPQALARLQEQLPQAKVVTSIVPEHASIWARHLWREALDHPGPVCLLNDDIELCPDFPAVVEALAAAAPDECLSLCCTNPNAIATGAPWVRAYHYSGPGVVLPPGTARSLLDFSASLPWSWVSRVNEDVLANAWAWDRQRPFLYPLPSPVQHRIDVLSTLGYDHHPNRQAHVFGAPAIAPPVDPPFVELEWARTEALKYQRLVFRAGAKLCTMCLGREGQIGNGTDVICLACLADLTALALKGPK